MSLNFACDYMQGCLPSIMDRFVATNMEGTVGYGQDQYSLSAKKKIKEACDCENGEVEFLVGGTQANQTVIKALLRNYQGVIACESGHVAVHEAGAIETTGHKVITIPGKLGKLEASSVASYMETFFGDETYPHMVQPGMIYISQPTEYGTLYSKKELEALRKVCDAYHLYLYVDGARLAYALGSSDNDVSLKDIAKYADAFYIGGTKCGTLFGEAVVIPDQNLIPCFFTTIKQGGALLAKGRMTGIQFDEMFTNDLYLKAGRKAVEFSKKITDAFAEHGYEVYMPTYTNQLFINFEDVVLKKFQEKVSTSFWAKTDDTHTLIRLATSWATTEEEVDELIAWMKECK